MGFLAMRKPTTNSPPEVSWGDVNGFCHGDKTHSNFPTLVSQVSAMMRKGYSNPSDGLVFPSHPTQPLVGLPVNRVRLSDGFGGRSLMVMGQPPVDWRSEKFAHRLDSSSDERVDQKQR
jgi:hypothetical protein